MTHQHKHSIFWHQDGHTPKLIRFGLSAESAGSYLDHLSRKFGQPVLPDGIVNESAEPNCGYYYVEAEDPQ